MALLKEIKKKAWFFLHRHRRHPAVARVAGFCKNIHRATEHPTFDLLINGEQAALRRLAGSEQPVIFDVGANRGDWAAMALALFPKATLHAFELSPAIAETLAARFTSFANVSVHPFGLADRTDLVDFYSFSGAASELSTIRTPLYHHVPHTVARGQVMRGDEFCQVHGIEFIHYLKIDAENADWEVLQGFANLLQQQKVGCVQFEHEGGRFLKDFYDFLQPRGYVIGKLYANYIDFRAHDRAQEDFLGPNYIALPARETVKIQEMIKGW